MSREHYILQNERIGQLLEKHFALLFIPACIFDASGKLLFTSSGAEKLLRAKEGSTMPEALFTGAEFFLDAALKGDWQALKIHYGPKRVYERAGMVTVFDMANGCLLIYGFEDCSVHSGEGGTKERLRFAARAELDHYDFSISPPIPFHALLRHFHRHPEASLAILDNRSYYYLSPQVIWNYFNMDVPSWQIPGAPMYQFLATEDAQRHMAALDSIPANTTPDKPLLWHQKRPGGRQGCIRAWPGIFTVHGQRVNFSLIHDISPETAEFGKEDGGLTEKIREKLQMFAYVSAPMACAVRQLRKAAACAMPVCIMGETGTGKTQAAGLIHEAGRQGKGPFIAINCGAIPEALFESALFGHVRGAFTGAMQHRKGAMALAAGGTLLLDEIGELPISCQAKLLQALSERKFRPVGSDQSQDCRFRLIAATNRDLHALVEKGLFREDLYYRIHVFEIFLPPLREHLEDIPSLVQAFCATHQLRCNFSRKDLAKLISHRWPGNIRELENVVLRYAIEGNLDFFVPDEAEQSDIRGTLRERLLAAERQIIIATLERQHWNRTLAARELGISRVTLFRKIRDLHI